MATRERKHLCITCGKDFTKSCNLSRHMRIHNAEKVICSHCGKNFKTPDYLRFHIRKEHSGEEKPIMCLICGLVFGVRLDLKRHMRHEHKGQKPPRLPYVCSECGKGFGRPKLLEDHMVTHTGAKPYNCSDCGQGFLHEYQYEKHVAIHQAKKHNVCPECGQGFSSHERLTTHMQTHLVHVCPDCGKEFKSESSLMIHYNQHSNPFECSACGTGFSDESQLKKHMAIHKTCPGAPYVCSECGQWFSDPDELKDHMWSHKPDAQVLCQECHRSFSSKAALNIHMRSHSGVRTHICPGCCKVFKTAAYLDIHITNCDKANDSKKDASDNTDVSAETKVEVCDDTEIKSNLFINNDVDYTGEGASNDENYNCQTCGKTFELQDQLVAHQRTHSGESLQPFSCIHCFLTFRTPALLKSHIDKKHTGTQDLQYACPECMKGLPSPEALKVHMIIHEQGSHVCSECGKEYETSDLLTIHLQTHRTSRETEHTETSPVLDNDRSSQPSGTDVKWKKKINKQSQNTKSGHHACPTCGKEFDKLSHMRAHAKRHTALRQFWCPRCGKGFTEAVVLKRHMLTHGGKKPVQCMECGKRFMDLWHLKIHLKAKTHRHKKDIPCPTCGKGVSSAEALKQHMKIHMEKVMGENDSKKIVETEGNYSDESDRGSNQADRQMLDDDYTKSNRGTRSSCSDNCEFNSNHSSVDAFQDDVDENSQLHLNSKTLKSGLQTPPVSLEESEFFKLITGQQKSEPPVCEGCGKTFESKSEMRAHMKQERCYECTECGKRFGEAVVLRRHLLIHSGKKPHPCLQCGKRFMDSFKLKKHMRTHARKKTTTNSAQSRFEADQKTVEVDQVKEEPVNTEEYDEDYLPKRTKKAKHRHVCFVCGKDFKTLSNLKSHAMRHLKERPKPFVCKHCGKAFAEAGVLKRHTFIHEGKKPKQCSECGKRFMDVTHLRAHMQTHTNEKPFSCHVCHKGMCSKHSLAYHLKSFHQDENLHVCSECGKNFQTLDDLNDHVEKHIKSVEMEITNIENKIHNTEAQLETEDLPPDLRKRSTRSKTVCQQEEHLKSHTIKYEPDDEAGNDINIGVVDLFENYIINPERLAGLDPTETEDDQNHLSPQILDVLDDHRRAHAAEADSANSNDGEAFENDSDGSVTKDVIDDVLATEAQRTMYLDLEFDTVMSDESEGSTLEEIEGGKSEASAKSAEKSDGRPICPRGTPKSTPLTPQVARLTRGREMKRSKDGKPICPLCGKVFNRGTHMRAHMVTHTKVRPFTCDECGHGFTEAGSLRRHMMIHTGEKPFPCSQCHKAFRTRTHLKKHLLTHRGRVYNLKKNLTKAKEPAQKPEPNIPNISFKAGGNDLSPDLGRSEDVLIDPALAEAAQSLFGSEILDMKDGQWKRQAAQAGGVSSDEDEVASHHSESSVSIDLDDHTPAAMEDLSMGHSGTDLSQHNLQPQDIPVDPSLLDLEDGKSDNMEGAIVLESSNSLVKDSQQKKQPMKVKTKSKGKVTKRRNQRYRRAPKGKTQAIPRPSMEIKYQQFSDGKYACPVCSKVFTKRYNIKAHMVVHTKERPFVCAECGNGFTEAGSLRRHMMIHTGEKPFLCKLCNKAFRTSTHLKAHMLTHTGIKNFHCKECGKAFSNATALRMHNMIHTGEKPYVCLVCNKGFRVAVQLDYHMISHSSIKANKKGIPSESDYTAQIGADNVGSSTKAVEKPFMCPECGKCFGTNGILKKHKMIHTGEKPYLCSECGKKFIDATKLKDHMGTHSNKKAFSCSECHKSYSAAHSLMAHMKKKHPGEGACVCVGCGKGYISLAILGEHLPTCYKVKELAESEKSQPQEKAGSNNKLFQCIECGKCYGTRGILKNHMLIHTGEKPHECCYCGKKFRISAHLKRHLLTHTGEKPYACSKCDQRFAASGALNIHYYRAHSGETPYACAFCGEAFRTLGLLGVHTKTCYRTRYPYPSNKESRLVLNKDQNEAITFTTELSQSSRKRKAVLEAVNEYTYASCYLCVQGFDGVSELIAHLAVHALAL